MAVIKKSAVVPFTCEEMYKLVNDVEAYPSYLPWCSDAQVLEQSDERLSASVSMAVGRVKQSFSTENIMQPGKRIEVRLLSGPFKYLNGYWHFEVAGERSCRISLQMNFEFKSRLLKLALDKVFNRIMLSLIEAFTERAHQLYGPRTGK